MIERGISDQQKRAALRAGLVSGKLQRFPGAFSPLIAMMIEQYQFEGFYVSGAVLSASQGLPDIGLTSVTEVVTAAGQMARATNLPAMADLDTGFGEPVNTARGIRLAEDAGLAAVHLEDQTLPKRCGHLDHKELVDRTAMVRKIKAAVDARRDATFTIIARTDARSVEGLPAAIARAQAYVDAGADAVFPEALETEAEFAAFRSALPVPLVANMTEFGKSPLLTTEQLENLGYNVVIFPVTLLRLALQQVQNGLPTLAGQGTQQSLVGSMLTRARLYEILGYARYAHWDQKIVNFQVKDGDFEDR